MAWDWKQAVTLLGNGAVSSRLPVLASGFAVVLLAYSAAHLTWMFFPPPPEAQAPPPASTMQTAAAPRMDALSLSRAIAQRHLLGSAQSADVPPSGAPIPETRLNLQLRGVVASEDSEVATAIVADPAGKEEYYRVGDELPGGAVLKEVHPQHIVISRGGRFETLRLPQESLQVDNGPGVAGGMPPVSSAPARVAPDAGAALQDFREQFMQDPQTLANLLQGEPYRQNGHFLGYRVRPGRDGALFAKFGLQSGDVITAVNGVSVVDPQGRLELMRSIGSASQVSVDLLRHGAAQSISISVAQ